MVVRVELNISGDLLFIRNRSQSVVHELSAFADSAVDEVIKKYHLKPGNVMYCESSTSQEGDYLFLEKLISQQNF